MILTPRSRTRLRPLPAACYAALAAGDEYHLRPGRYVFSAGYLTDWGSGAYLRGDAATLVDDYAALLGTSLWGPVAAYSPPTSHPPGPQVFSGFGHLQGAITGGLTDELPWGPSGPYPTPLAAGEVVLVMVGVHADHPHSDPAEPWCGHYMTVAEDDGVTVRFTTPFPDTVPVFADEAAVQASVVPELSYKIGDYGEDLSGVGGTNGRGYGTDHSVLRFAAGAPTTGVRIDGVTVETVGMTTANLADCPNNGWAYNFTWCRDVALNRVAVRNCPGHVVHAAYVDGLTVAGVTTAGVGVFKNGTTLYGSYALSLYGGKTIRASGLAVGGTNFAVYANEINPEDVEVTDVVVTAVAAGLSGGLNPVQLNNYGQAKNGRAFRRWTLPGTAALMAGGVDSADPMEDFNLPAGTADGLRPDQFLISGLAYGSRTYSGQPATQDDNLLVAPAGAGPVVVLPPAGLLTQASLELLVDDAALTAVTDAHGYEYTSFLKASQTVDLHADPPTAGWVNPGRPRDVWIALQGGDPATAHAVADAKRQLILTFSGAGSVTLACRSAVCREQGHPRTTWTQSGP